jgi:cyclase
MNRTVIVARIEHGAEAEVARIFADSDATSLPVELGVRQRSLYRLGDAYIHVVEFNGDPGAALLRGRDLPGFRQISADLNRFIRPYDEANWRSPQDAVAHEFYRWNASS